ncbi:MAG TPA: 7TM domain-containing protein [Phycisphaerales bacterium]|nr:7TM domain-containing protein [Phycisphaerales bacterium]
MNTAMTRSRRAKYPRFSKRTAWSVIAVLVLISVLSVGYKLTALPGADVFAYTLSFDALPHDMRHRAVHLLVAPIGALVVVLFRLTLGIRVLGPFRSVLLAVAFEMTGIAVGLAAFTIVVCAIVALRPVYKRLRLAYFGRSAAMLASVAGILILCMLGGLALGMSTIEHLAFFPVVVMTLTGEAFANTYRREGTKSAVWRTGMTAVVGVIITLLTGPAAVREALLRFPEITLLCLAGILVIGTSCKFRMLQAMNPPRRKSKRSTTPTVPSSQPLPQT